MSRLVLFEDEAATRFLPLSWTRPVFDLRCGIWTLRQAIEQELGDHAACLVVRDFLAPVTRERTGLPVNDEVGPGPWLLVNGRLLGGAFLRRVMDECAGARRFLAPDGTLLAASVEGASLQQAWKELESLPAETVRWPLLEWPWQLFQRNGERLTTQAESWPLGEQPAISGVHLVEPQRIYIHSTARVQPGVVLDASDGPIVIDEGATVMANAVLQGPSYLGRGSSIKIGAKIYHNTTIGPVCKVGGEVEECIFHGFSNKQHDGFLGHTYVGEWCNFGADTNNSDLKNNYGSVSVWCDGSFRDTGSMFVGLFMGDHSKTGINSTLNTGTVVGVSCNLYGSGVAPRYLPSFSWGGGSFWSDYRLAEALNTAERVMARRNIPLTGAERELLAYIFNVTSADRDSHWGTAT